MRKSKIKNGNYYYSIENNPLVIVKFLMSDDIYICNTRWIFGTFVKAKVRAVKMLNKNHFQGLKKLEKPISQKTYDERILGR